MGGVRKMSIFSDVKYYVCRGVEGGWVGWAHTHPDFGKIEGAAGQRRHAALLLAHPDFQTLLHP